MGQLFLLIDGNSLVNRAFYALPPMLGSDGRPTQAVYGFASMLIKAINDYKPSHIAVAFDMRAPTFRHQCYSGYKATRKGMPDELAQQLPMLKQLLTDMGIKTVEKAGFEADDIIGTLSQGEQQTIIITGDRDAFQLISPTTRVGYTKKGISSLEIMDERTLAASFGLLPQQIIDFKALAGDVSDNIPGVEGIGDKGALSLLSQFNGLESIYENIDSIKGAVRQRLIDGKESAFLSKRLATIDCAAPIEITAQDCAFFMPMPQAARQRLVEYGINSIASRQGLFADDNRQTQPQQARQMPKIVELQSLDGFEITEDFALICDGQRASIATKSAQYNISIAQSLIDFGVSRDKFTRFIVPLLGNDQLKKTLFDSKTLMREFDCAISNYFDVRLALYVAGERAETEAEFCASRGYQAEYAAFALLNESEPLIKQLSQANQQQLYYEIELPLTRVLFCMEKRGFKLDMELNGCLNDEFNGRIAKIAQEIYQLAHTEFNINSPKQLSQVLFEQLQIPYPKKSKSYSTAFEILQPLAQSYPIVKKVLDYRQIAKLNGTYIEGLKRLADKNGVVHTEFKQTLTTTGRLSSIEPNLQNIPIREEEGRRIRGLFVAHEGHSLICVDYSQIELRLLAHFSGDEVMCNAFNTNQDIHAQTAERVFGIKNDYTRAQAKAVNFGIIYGISDFGLAAQLHIPVFKAKEIINQYFDKFPSIRAYLDKSVAQAAQSGCATTMFNRIRPLPELKSSNAMLRKFGERAAMNMPLQGTAADIIKAAMIKVDKALTGTGAQLILQVHDELIVECPDDKLHHVSEILKQGMENIVRLSIPLRVSTGIGKRWSDCK